MKISLKIRNAFIIVTFINVLSLVGIDQKLSSLKTAMESLANEIQKAPCQPYYQPSQIAQAQQSVALVELVPCLLLNRGVFPLLRFGGQIPPECSDLLKKKAQEYLKQHYPPSYQPSTIQIIENKKAQVDQALMIGLFIDEFSDPIKATYVAGLASYIYKLLLDQNSKPQATTALLPGSCNGSVYAPTAPYNDFVKFVQKKFNTSTVLAKTAQQMLNSTLGTDRLLHAMPDADYEAAAAYWDTAAPTSNYVRPMAERMSINYFDRGFTAPVEPQAHDRIQSAISHKINQFRPVRKKA